MSRPNYRAAGVRTCQFCIHAWNQWREPFPHTVIVCHLTSEPEQVSAEYVCDLHRWPDEETAPCAIPSA